MALHTRLMRIVALVSALLMAGATGYHYLEGWSWFDGLYMTVITLATVGFNEVRVLTTEGRLFTIVLIVFGVSTMTYTVTQVTGFVVEGQLNQIFRGRRMGRLIERMADHYIVCGFGRIGHSVVSELIAADVPFVLIADDDSVRDLTVEGREILAIVGDATDEETLQRAGIERASGLIAALPNDADNVMVTLTARDLNMDLIIVARATQESAIPKLQRAGANRVVSPYDLGGRRMASIVLRPSVMDFLDVMMHPGEMEMRVEQITIPSHSCLEGKTIRETAIGEKTGAIILAVRTLDGQIHSNPGPSHVIKEWELLIVMGRADQIQALKTLCDD